MTGSGIELRPRQTHARALGGLRQALADIRVWREEWAACWSQPSEFGWHTAPFARLAVAPLTRLGARNGHED